MNFVCGMLLLLLEEEDAYWVMVTILGELVPHYYNGNLIGNMADQKVLEELLKNHLPACYEALQSNGVAMELFATQWLLSLYVNALPTETVLRVWDMFFYDGREVCGHLTSTSSSYSIHTAHFSYHRQTDGSSADLFSRILEALMRIALAMFLQAQDDIVKSDNSMEV